MMLLTLPNLHQEANYQESHIFDLPVCCPVSKNPRPDSTLTISYTPKSYVLEVAALYALIAAYVGGLSDEAGDVVVRDMEGMIVTIAQTCQEALQVPVTVSADLVLLPSQRMHIDYVAQ